jgi:hypothetical protein
MVPESLPVLRNPCSGALFVFRLSFHSPKSVRVFRFSVSLSRISSAGPWVFFPASVHDEFVVVFFRCEQHISSVHITHITAFRTITFHPV